MPVSVLKCARCQQPLPEGSGFCVSCGCNNDMALLERQAKVGMDANRRIERLGFWKRLSEALPFLRIFTR